jgi:hypothetical protein
VLTLPTWILAPTCGVHAQVAASASLESEYDVRGVTLDQGRPDARFGLTYDDQTGAYAGASGLITDTPAGPIKPIGYNAYAGYARRTSSGQSWDIGVTTSGLRIYRNRSRDSGPNRASKAAQYRADYTELYVGVSLGDSSFRVSLSPDYLSQRARTAYLEFNHGFRMNDWLRFYVHSGAMTPLAAHEPAKGALREQIDIGTGLIWTMPQSEFRLGWSFVTPKPDYAQAVQRRQNRFLIGYVRFF